MQNGTAGLPSMTMGRSKIIVLLAAATAWGCTSTFDDLEPAANCTPAHPPDRPSTADDDLTSLDFVVAVNEYDLGEIDRGAEVQRFRTMGFDLDQACTGQGDGPTCTNVWTTSNPPIDGDALDGRDNTQGAVLFNLRNVELGRSTSELVNSFIDSGAATTLLRVRRYNGLPNDRDVEVQVFAGTMMHTGAPLAWQGNDEWAAVHGWVEQDERGEWSAERPTFFDAAAYVTDGMLVAHLKQFRTAGAMLSQVVITARIDQTLGLALAEGTMAGRAKTNDLLAGLREFPDSETGEKICIGTKNYPKHKRTVCSASDISFSPSADPSSQCDATSWGFHFTALPAKLSGAVPVPWVDLFANACEPGNFPGDDSCDNLD
jgi:hypothetical protein